MTYCALIDVCGRCGRSDLALKGLRMMLRQKAQEIGKDKRRCVDRLSRSHQDQVKPHRNNNYNEVGAWTAAINACGRAGRLDTAIKLFKTMSKYGSKPNQVTCGCLTDCLLKSNDEDYMNETLNVLRYMKEEGIKPSEVMYTSLMTAATRLAKLENERKGELVLRDFGDRRAGVDINSSDSQYKSWRSRANVGQTAAERTKAIEIYTELILSLGSLTTPIKGNPRGKLATNKIASNNLHKESNALLVKVFLVFQEMKASGSDPDLTCYNALLRACAQVGEISRLWDVMRRLQCDGLFPDNTSWKEMLRGAAKARRSDVAEKVWIMAVENSDEPWVPNIDSFDLLITSFIRHASVVKSKEAKMNLYLKVIDLYIATLQREEQRGLNNINVDSLKRNKKIMMMIMRGANFVERSLTSKTEFNCPFSLYELRQIVAEISMLDSLKSNDIFASAKFSTNNISGA